MKLRDRSYDCSIIAIVAVPELTIDGLSSLPQRLPQALGISQLTLGVGLVLVLYWRPGGLLGSQEVVLGRGRGRTGSD